MLREVGRLDDGRSVQAIALGSASGLQAEVLDYGGILRRLSVPGSGGRVSVVLGHADLAAYWPNNEYLGILVGRFGNRIARARFRLDGREYPLSANEGRNHLHGGHLGFGRQLWRISESAPDRLVLAHRSPAGDEGYPGTLDVTASFRIEGDCLELAYTATTDAPTPVNLTHHPYFNLAGDASIPAAQQWLRVPADRYLPVDRELIPTGEIASVDATPFDFRQPAMAESARSAHEQIARGKGYDHCLVLADDADCVAELYSPHSGVAMRIVSAAPAVQFYEGQGLDASQPHLGRGFCLEPQGFPDAPNRPEFSDSILLPGQTYRRRIRYCFAAVPPHSDWSDAIAALDRNAPKVRAP
ncbi:MAG TPA: aldose epimerase family protein [Pseudoxanthomonas sp.]|nr:aldose epimerase family protein [Pseudoxanthomonas sp.]